MSIFDTVTFLQEYEKFPCLWQKSCPEFKIRAERDHAEQMLLPTSKLANVKLLRRKIRSIRCTYNQEVAKIKKSLRTGSADVYRPKLAWFEIADRFLRQNVEDYETDFDFTFKGEPEHQNEFIGDDRLSLSPSNCPASPVPSSQTSRKRLRLLPRIKKENDVDDPLDIAVEVLEQAASRPQSIPNEFISFGQYIAVQMNCLPLEEAIILQGEIQKLITAARLKNIRESKS